MIVIWENKESRSQQLEIVTSLSFSCRPVLLIFYLKGEAVVGETYFLGVYQLCDPLLELFEGWDVVGYGHTAGQFCEVYSLRISAEESWKGLIFLNVVRIQYDSFLLKTADDIQSLISLSAGHSNKSAILE